MSQKVSCNKRIAKNTLLLYLRMLCMMLISLYTSRIVLATLGVDDFGIYNVVGGIVVILSFLKNSMAGATQRFLNFELGRGDTFKLKSTFATAVVIHFFLALIVLIMSESVGVWFLNTFIKIAPERFFAANWVLQFSILSFLPTIVSVPYHAAIISHEKMGVFACISIAEAVLKLFVVYLLVWFSFDKLILYAAFMACVSIFTSFLNVVYARKKFAECRGLGFHYDKSIKRRMLGFSGWTVFGALSTISHTQGIAIVINMFFGVAVNAAQGIANQVIHIVNMFVSNFMMALNPQIVKTYAANEYETMHGLIKSGCRIGICLVSFFAIPLILETPAVLTLWLKSFPDYTVVFIRIILLTSICNSFASPLAAAQGATGKIKTYQLVLTILGWLHLPLAWLFFYMGCEPYYAMYIYFVLVCVMQFFRIYMVCKSVNMPIIGFYKDVVFRCFFSIILASILPTLLHLNLSSSIINAGIVVFSSLISVSFFCYFVALTKNEKNKIKTMLVKKIKGKRASGF